jgi:hypothetical protein
MPQAQQLKLRELGKIWMLTDQKNLLAQFFELIPSPDAPTDAKAEYGIIGYVPGSAAWLPEQNTLADAQAYFQEWRRPSRDEGRVL